MKTAEFVVKFLASVVISVLGVFMTVVIFAKMLLLCFRDGYLNIFTWKDRTKEVPPIHYTTWDAETRNSSPVTGKRWNHAYVTVPESGLRFHYVYSGTVPTDITISNVDGETSQVVDNNNIVTNRPKLLLCAHGYPENWFSWRHILRYFDKPRPDIGDYFVVAVDMRGFGDSDKPSGYKSYHLNLLCSDLKGIALALGYDTFSLVGHDWGAVVTWKVAEIYPNSLEKMIIINGPEAEAMMKVASKNLMQCLKSWYIVFFQIPGVSDLYIRLHDYKFITELFCSRETGIRNVEHQLTNEELEMMKYGVRHSITAPTNYYRALLWPFSNPGPGLVYPEDTVSGDPLKQTQILILWGDEDSFLEKAIPELTKSRLNSSNGSGMVYVKDASHWLHQDNPDVVIQHMAEFLRR